MKKVKQGHKYYFVDESGDTTFYNRRGFPIVGTPGCSSLLILGFIGTRDPRSLRRKVLDFQRKIVEDPRFKDLPSISKTKIALHAKNDAPAVRDLFFNFIADLDFEAQFVIARKDERIFREDYGANKAVFYDDLITILFQTVLHRYTHNTIIFAQRSSRVRQAPLNRAISKAKNRFEQKTSVTINNHIQIQAQTPKGEPCLSVIDYLNWAVQRAYTANDMSYFNMISDKVSILRDIFDQPKGRNKTCYHRKNRFDINKATPLELGSEQSARLEKPTFATKGVAIGK